jgi:hypothetical protein
LSQTVAVLRDNLLIVTGVRPENLYETQNMLRDKGVDLQLIGFPEDTAVLDLRDAPPAITEAAKLVDEYLRKAHG